MCEHFMFKSYFEVVGVQNFFVLKKALIWANNTTLFEFAFLD